MEDIKNIIAKNITALRTFNNMTQLDLAEKLNYSDKTISKWERGESSPDISVLVEIANLFSVSLDDLVKDSDITEKNKKEDKEPRYNRKAITYTVDFFIVLLAIMAFVITSYIAGETTFKWLYFLYAVPVLLIVRLVLNSVWFNPRNNYGIISALMWSVLAGIHLTFLYFKINIPLIYLLGIAGQIIIIIWSFIKNKKDK